MSLKEKLGEELYSQVMEKLDDDTKLIINDGSYIPKEKFDEANEKAKKLKEQLADRDSQIEQLKNDTQASEELQSRIEKLQKQNEEKEKEMEQQLNQVRLNSEVEKALISEKARNPKAAKALLDMDKIKLEDGKVKGLDEQVQELKKSDDYLFGETGLKGDDPVDGKGHVGTEYKDNPWKNGNVNLGKQSEIMRENPGLAKKLIEKAGKDPAKYNL